MEELSGSELLAHRAFAPADGKGADGPADEPSGGVRCGRPLIYPVPVEDLPGPVRRRAEALGGHYVGALFAFDLDPLPTGRRYVAARFDVTMSDPRAVAVRLDTEGGALGMTYGAGAPEAASATAARTIQAAGHRPGWLGRLAARSQTSRAWVSGLQSGEFGWAYDDPGGDLLLPRSYGMHALLEVPARATTIGGRIGVRVETASRRGRRAASLGESLAFAEQLTPADLPAGAAVRLCMAADVSGYSRRTNAETERIQEQIVDLLRRAREAAGVPEAAVRPQPQGDGQFTVLPVGIDEAEVIPDLLRGLDDGLRDLNAGADRLRIRVALHRGLIKEGRNGWIGTAPIAVHRILDCGRLRTALTDNVDADFVLGLPDVLYRDVIVHAVKPPLPDDFTEMVVELPEKGFIENCWLYVAVS